MLNRLAVLLGAACLALPMSAAAASEFVGSLTITPDNPGPINVGPPGIDLLGEWTTNDKDLTRFRWLIDGTSLGTGNVAAGEAVDGDEFRHFEFLAADDYEVCLHVYHHAQAARTLLQCVTVSVLDQSCAWEAETAWADGDGYNATQGGNWATYTPYFGEAEVDLYAGQTLLAGTVAFSDPDADDLVMVTIELDSGWQFAGGADNVKIQDYDAAPSGNPSPGQFATKGTASNSTFTIVVPANFYYGVHVDVERCELEN